jgi:hypothetical protein
MNCGHHIREPDFDNDLICTAYSPKRQWERAANKSIGAMDKGICSFTDEAYSHAGTRKNRACE